MEAYAAVLNYAIPFFVILILIEYLAGRMMGKITIRSMDTISSLSSGMTNILKDVLGLSIVILSYSFMVKYLALFDIKTTWLLYVLAFVGKDFAGYWTHRFEHVINVFWNRHIIHHSSEEFNLACALRQSISGIFGIFTFLYLPMAILGVPTEVIAVVAPLHLFAQFWYHTTLINKMGFLEYIIVTPSHHRVHHAINDEYIDKNFSQIFIIWDKLFGTFQEELPDVPPVYGVKKPVKTWNPFLINFMHIWQIAKDAFRTEKLWDKVRIWFMPTGWRPNDVKKKYPIEIITDMNNVEKYDTPNNLAFRVWHWTQLMVTLLLILYLFNNIVLYDFFNVLLYAGFIALNIFSYTTLMDRKKWAIYTELFKFGVVLSLVYYWSGWYGVDRYFSYATYIFLSYQFISLLITFYFTFRQESAIEEKMAIS